MIQTILCFIIVFFALIYLVRYYFARSKKKDCGSCGSCDTNNTKQENEIISIPLSRLKRRKK